MSFGSASLWGLAGPRGRKANGLVPGLGKRRNPNSFIKLNYIFPGNNSRDELEYYAIFHSDQDDREIKGKAATFRIAQV